LNYEERKRVWVDPFQTRLTVRIAAYLVLFLLVLGNFLFAWRLLSEGASNPAEQFVRMFWDFLPVLVCLLVLVPVMAWDAIRFTHRLVGPMVRFRRTMQSIAEGKMVRPIKLREGDYLTELRDDFNHMLESLQQRGVSVLQPGVPAEGEPAPKPVAPSELLDVPTEGR
jgi:hypothetical protein